MRSLPLRALPDTIDIREVGPRDGLQNEPTMLTTAQKIALVDMLSASGLRAIEVGAFVRAANVPQMADSAAVFAGIRRRAGVTYSAIVPNVIGARRAVEAGADTLQMFFSTSESHNRSNVNMSIADSLAQASQVAQVARDAGCGFDAVLSVVFGCPFEGDVPVERVLQIAEQVLALGASQITLGDTTGMAHPRLVQDIFAAFEATFPGLPVRFHPHSARGAGLANVLAAMQVGVTRFDASLGGIGGCPFAPGAPGNICTEDFVHMVHEMGIATGIDLPLLLESAHALETMLGHDIPGQTLRAGLCQHLPADGGPRPYVPMDVSSLHARAPLA